MWTSSPRRFSLKHHVYRLAYNHGLPRCTSSVPFFAPSLTLIHRPRRGSRPIAATSKTSAGILARFDCFSAAPFSSTSIPFDSGVTFCHSSVFSLPCGTASSCRLLTTPAAGMEATKEKDFSVGASAHSLISPSHEPRRMDQGQRERDDACTHQTRKDLSPGVPPVLLSISVQRWHPRSLNHAVLSRVRGARRRQASSCRYATGRWLCARYQISARRRPRIESITYPLSPPETKC